MQGAETAMSSLEQHCQDSIAKLGQPFEDVHRWMDEYAGKEGYGMRHRRKRHHLQGIREAASLFGREAEAAARLHIGADLKEEGWKEETDHFPVDEADYVRMGLY
jgi:hypothetical protein